MDGHDLLMFYMSTLENTRQGAESTQPSRPVKHHKGQCFLAVPSILLRRRHHAAAIVFSVHGGGDPHFVVCIPLSVHCHRGSSRRKAEQQTLNGDGGIIDLFVGLLAELVPFLAAVAVKAETNAVKEVIGLAFYLHRGQIFQLLRYREGVGIGLLAEFPSEVIACANGEIENFREDLQPCRVVGKAAQRTVSPCHDEIVIGAYPAEKGSIIGDLRHVEESLCIGKGNVQHFGIFFLLSVSAERIIQYIKISHSLYCPHFLFCLNQRVLSLV